MALIVEAPYENLIDLRERAKVEVESEVRPSFPGYRFRESDPAVELAATALLRAGYEPSYALSGGGADANVFNARGLTCVNLANGMAAIHTPEEHIAVGHSPVQLKIARDEAALSDPDLYAHNPARFAALVKALRLEEALTFEESVGCGSTKDFTPVPPTFPVPPHTAYFVAPPSKPRMPRACTSPAPFTRSPMTPFASAIPSTPVAGAVPRTPTAA